MWGLQQWTVLKKHMQLLAYLFVLQGPPSPVSPAQTGGHPTSTSEVQFMQR